MALQQDGARYYDLTDERKAYFKVLLQKELRRNTYDTASLTVTVSGLRAGTVALAWFIFGLKGGWSINKK